jgi:hypothetical protein
LKKMNSDLCLCRPMVVLELADIFVSNAFNNVFEGALFFMKIEPRITLQLLAPLIEFCSTLVSSEVEWKCGKWQLMAYSWRLQHFGS